MSKIKQIEIDNAAKFPFLNLKDVVDEIISKNKKLDFEEVYCQLCDFLELKALQLMNEYPDEMVLFFKDGLLHTSCISMNLMKYNKQTILEGIKRVLKE